MARVDTHDVLELLYEFLDTSSGERFAITNQSLLEFTRYVATQLDSGTSLQKLRKRAPHARDFAISSALKDNSTVRVGIRDMPLIREKDERETENNCDNFPDF